MKASFHVRVLIDNAVHRGGLAAEHGWSVWMETPDGGILFDTGQTGLCLQNARTLGVPLENTRHIVLSHGHYDHTGGLVEAWDVAPQAKLHLHPAAIQSKYVKDRDGSARYIGMPLACIEAIQSRPDRVVWSEQPVEIAPGVFVTGPIPRNSLYEDTGGAFFQDTACQLADPLMDDQAVYRRTAQGLVVVLGCAHAGVVNTLNWIEHLEPGMPVYALLGGMHLGQASPERLSSTLDFLRHKSIAHLHPAHCTGWPANVALANAFPGACQPCSVGFQWVFASEVRSANGE
jgi:7,8-dihydropterin-6-yl-methyl-4-(beta-D-ribofuranosyl)aminobenzene 5'-phosphate synthase